MEESGKTSLKQIIQEIAGDGAAVIQGRVISASPLKVQAVNDEKLIISENSLYVPRSLTDFCVEITAVGWETEETGGGAGESAYDSHSHSIEGRKKIIVHNALKAGDTVRMLAAGHGKQYYILDRV